MILYTIVPCYNEEDCLDDTCSKLKNKYYSLISDNIISENSKILFVDDGSKDRSWEIIKAHVNSNTLFSAIRLSANCGHQNALMAGLQTAKDKCDAAITIDADLQDDIDSFENMIQKFSEGCEIVYGVRKKRDTDSLFKKFSAELYYMAISLLGVRSIYNHADFRLMSNCAINALSNYSENRLFLRGLIPQLGYKSDCVYYDRKERKLGKSKYSFGKMFSLAVNGLFSFTTRPIDIILFLGIMITFLSVIALIVLFFRSSTNSTDISSWILGSIFLCTGIIVSCLGVVGEYIGIAMYEIKRRPKYIIAEKI